MHFHGPHRHQLLLSRASGHRIKLTKPQHLDYLRAAMMAWREATLLAFGFHGAQAVGRLRRRAKEEHSPIRATATMETKAQ